MVSKWVVTPLYHHLLVGYSPRAFTHFLGHPSTWLINGCVTISGKGNNPRYRLEDSSPIQMYQVNQTKKERSMVKFYEVTLDIHGNTS